MNRTIKYKVWDKRINKMYEWEEVKNWNFYWVDAEYYVFLRFIGRIDKNGVEIFSGDIIRRYTGYTFIVEVREYNLGSQHHTKCFGYELHKDDEVIGNYLQHPELLKQPIKQLK